MTVKKRIFIALILIFSILVVGACGSRSTNVSGVSDSPTTTVDRQSPEGSSNQEREVNLPKVSMSVAVRTLAYAPVFIAEEQGYFTEEGVNLQTVLLEGGGPAVQALVGDSVQFAAIDTSGITQSNEKGINLISIVANYNRMTQDLVVTESVLERKGVTPDSPITERFKALEGLTLGITSAGAASDVFTRYYLHQAGLQPQIDTKIIDIGGAANLVAAMKNGQIDGFMTSPPQPQQLENEGIGRVFISGSADEIPGLESFPYTVVATKRSYADKNPQIVASVSRAIGRAANLMIHEPDEAFSVLRKIFDTIDPTILEKAFKVVAQAVPEDGKMDEIGWQNTVRIHNDAGLIQADLDTKEGYIWTNEFLTGVGTRSN